MTIWTITMTGVALIFWAVSIAARIETRRLRQTLPGNALDGKDLARCIETLLEIRDIEVPSFAACAACKLPGRKSAWDTTMLLSFACCSARSVLREIETPVECEFCDDGEVTCPAPNCFGGNTRDGDYCPLCKGSGAIRCENCGGTGEC